MEPRFYGHRQKALSATLVPCLMLLHAISGAEARVLGMGSREQTFFSGEGRRQRTPLLAAMPKEQ